MSDWNNHRVDGILNGKCLSVVIDLNDTYSISNENPAFDAALDAFRNKNFDALIAAVRPIETVFAVADQMAEAAVTVTSDAVYFQGHEMHGVLIDRILEFARNGFDNKPLVLFLQNLMRNPSATAVNELYLFLEYSKTPMPITSDGKFLAYKKVRSDYMDIYSGTVSYRVGEEPSMTRNAVDDNRDRTCSNGLHFCSIGYLPHFGTHDPSGAKIVIVEIDPADVVSIPSDYSNTKGRACKMKVVGELSNEQYRQAIVGVSQWTSGYVDTTPKEPELDGVRLFSTRDQARNYIRNFGGKLKDTRSSNNRWSVVGLQPEKPTYPAFWSRSQARNYRDANGGIVVDTWKSQYEQYANDNENLRWVVID